MHRWASVLLACGLLMPGCVKEPPAGAQATSPGRPALRLYTLGDSNGVGPDAWPAQLRKRCREAMPGRRVDLYNDSHSGRAIGFAKFGPRSNALEMIDESLAGARKQFGAPIDDVVVGLGTNDAQNVWVQRGKSLDDVLANLQALVGRIRSATPAGQPAPRVTLLSPPPLGAIMDAGAPPAAGPAGIHQPKWHGAGPRLAELVRRMERLAAEEGVLFVNLHDAMALRADAWVGPDGVHLTSEGQAEVARLVAQALLGADAPQ